MRSTRLLAACALLVGAAVTASAAGAQRRAGPAITVVARGLDNPRQVVVARSGAVYVAEAGRAGTSCNRKTDTCFGYTSRVARVVGGKVQTVARGLLSVGRNDGTFTNGVAGVGVDASGAAYFVVTGSYRLEQALSEPRPECAPPRAYPRRAAAQLARLFRVTAGGVRPVVDLEALECAHNFDGADRSSNPYAVLALGGGHEIVADAGANDVFDVRGSKATLLAVLPKTATGAQSVPTSVALGPGNAYYVGEYIGGSAHPVRGAARVWKIVPGQTPVVYATGFNEITGLAFARDGTMYVTEYDVDPANDRQTQGDVVRVAPNGRRTRIGLGRLFYPAGAAVARNGTLYVSNWSVVPGTPPTAGTFTGRTGELVAIAP